MTQINKDNLIAMLRSDEMVKSAAFGLAFHAEKTTADIFGKKTDDAAFHHNVVHITYMYESAAEAALAAVEKHIRECHKPPDTPTRFTWDKDKNCLIESTATPHAEVKYLPVIEKLVEAIRIAAACGQPECVSLYDEEGVEGFQWTHPDGREWVEIAYDDSIHPALDEAIALAAPLLKPHAEVKVSLDNVAKVLAGIDQWCMWPDYRDYIPWAKEIIDYFISQGVRINYE
jgi:hypothetical protein